MEARDTEVSRARSAMRAALPDALWELRTPVALGAERADSHVLDWARRHGLTRSDASERRLASARLGDFAARVYPTATVEDLLLTTDWIAWLDFLDDQNDDRETALDPQDFDGFLARVALVASTGTADTALGPIGAALTDLWTRTRARAGERLCRRLRFHLTEYLAGNVQQAAYRVLGDVCDLGEYAVLRRAAGGVLVTFDLVEFAGGSELPPAVYYSRTYQRLLTAAGDVVCWTNDILTVEKESAAGDLLNLVTVLRESRRCARSTAFVQARELVDGRLGDFHRAARDLPDLCAALELDGTQRQALAACVELLRAWMRGHADWGLSTGRYAPLPADPGYLEDLLPGTVVSWNLPGGA
ncbi:terpene synthase family protein [Actinacidiphila acidipaludis]|uniref:Terpene synthase n=1 Tax=Actinacidiphila acidipaludis TaxID=2873382 RepID=A0ABS7QIM9_9ACTN|nr:terpene synthase [Streptomyces acidipaludis]MBY8883031.1 terpene synthase [Streptomyces acidipaludis]